MPDSSHISIHAPLAGRDGRPPATSTKTGNFNPRAPCGARPCCAPAPSPAPLYFNPRAPCGARHLHCGQIPIAQLISIHAPLAGRDVCTRQGQRRPRLFQSTRHSRRKSSAADFNPRAPCGARQRLRRERLLRCVISIHAPLAGRDGHGAASCQSHRYFNPRAPCGARHTTGRRTSCSTHFNPRAPCGARRRRRNRLRAGEDFNPRAPCGARPHTERPHTRTSNFNPRAPCGARPSFGLKITTMLGFQSTRPLRGATSGGPHHRQGY